MNFQFTYPSDYFDKHKSKPIVNIHHKTTPMKDLRKACLYQFQTLNAVPTSVVTAYLYRALGKIDSELKEDWTSYGQIIGTKDSVVHIWDMFEIKVHEGGPSLGEGGDDCEEEVDEWLPYLIVCMYRLSRLASNTYNQTRVLEKMKKLPVAAKFPNMLNLLGMAASCSNWMCGVGFTSLIAGIDMFFFQFQKHNMSFLRMGTINSRYKECGALIAFQNTRNIVTEQLSKRLYTWLLCEELKEDFRRMYSHDEELEKFGSYFPYQRDMGLVQNSAYSAKANQNLYFFSATIGSLLGDQSSRNVHFLLNRNLEETEYVSTLVAFVARHTLDLYPRFRPVGIPFKRPPDVLKDQEDEDKMPTTIDSNPWILYMKSRNNRYNEIMRQWFEDIRPTLKNSRRGTVGAYLHQHLGH